MGLISFTSGATVWQPSRNPARPQITPTPQQATARTAGGVTYGYDPVLTEELIPLTWNGLSAADLATLRTFFLTTAQGMVTPFILYDPWADASYPVSFATPEIVATETAWQRYRVSLTISRVL